MDIGLSRSQIVNLIFAIDADGDGAISKEEFEDAFKPVYLSRTATADELKAAGTEGTDEYVARIALARIGRLVLQSDTPIVELFALLDKDQSGALSHSDFGSLLGKLKLDPALEPREIELVLEAVDKNHDGTIDLDEFKSAF